MSSGRRHKCKLHSRGSKSSERLRGKMETSGGGTPFLDLGPFRGRDGDGIDWRRDGQPQFDISPMLYPRKASFAGHIGEMEDMGPGGGMRRIDDMNGLRMGGIPGDDGSLPLRRSKFNEFTGILNGNLEGDLGSILGRRSGELGPGLRDLGDHLGMRDSQEAPSSMALDAVQQAQAQTPSLRLFLADNMRSPFSPDRPHSLGRTLTEHRRDETRDGNRLYLFSPAGRLTAKGLAVLGSGGLGADLEGGLMDPRIFQAQETRSLGRHPRQLSVSPPPKISFGTSYKCQQLGSFGMDSGRPAFSPSRGGLQGRPPICLASRAGEFHSSMEAAVQQQMAEEQMMARVGHDQFERMVWSTPQASSNAGMRGRHFFDGCKD